jgi:hypothetical protein
MTAEKFKYLIRSTLNYFEPTYCPNCGNNSAIQIDRKYFVTKLLKCSKCYLQFRHPTDSKKFNESFYQSTYEQADGITTDLPSKEELATLLESGFEGSPKSVNIFNEIFIALLRDTPINLVDYGCSWGYMSYQFKKMGFTTQSFEISRPRSEYGKVELGVDIKTNDGELTGGSNIFFSSHVIEHVPSISSMVQRSQDLLEENGFFIAECPNGSSALRVINPNGFHHGWGLVHPNYLSEEFYQFLFRENPYFITTTPYNIKSLISWDQSSQVIEKTDGDQILVIAKPNVILSN